jgi:hypothetical protein
VASPVDVREMLSHCDDATMSWSLQFWVTIRTPWYVLRSGSNNYDSITHMVVTALTYNPRLTTSSSHVPHQVRPLVSPYLWRSLLTLVRQAMQLGAPDRRICVRLVYMLAL